MRSRRHHKQAGASDDARYLGKLYQHIYRVVRRIPRGRVATYGQVAELAGIPGAARVAGAAMRASVPALGLPWHRVVGKRSPSMATVSILDPIGAAVQKGLLEREGVEFTRGGGISLRDYGWLPTSEKNRRGPGKAKKPLAGRTLRKAGTPERPFGRTLRKAGTPERPFGRKSPSQRRERR